MKIPLISRSSTRVSLSLILLTVFLAACAAGTPTVAPTEPGVVEPGPTASSEPTADASTQSTAVAPEAPAETAVPVATSRGPDLHATDPSTVRLASGGLQLIEFFRFT